MIFRSENQTTGIPFTVRVVHQGDTYGLRNSLIHEREDPLIEFFDARFDHERAEDGAPLGQFISRYNLSTLEAKDGFTTHSPIHDGSGIDLQGDVDAWVVDADFIRGLSDFLVEQGLITRDVPEEIPGP
ncbi:hypothetical protein [Pseudosulfitobacter pseudonitzschiae]|uniref:hypothetical protein n=1 Tax=Pseudosulfitobacter pseudonitzschiae TaxID=1402135 RepID=UPI003B7D2A11